MTRESQHGSAPVLPSVRWGSSRGEMSPQARRLMILFLVGLIVIFGAWVTTNFLTRSTPSPVISPTRPTPPPTAVPPSPPPAPPVTAGDKEKEKPPSPEESTGRVVALPPPTAKTSPPAQPEKPTARRPTAKRQIPRPTGNYSLQVASMIHEENATGLKQQLEKLGYAVRIRKGSAPVTQHVVQIGEFANQAEAEETDRRLQQEGFRSTITPQGTSTIVEVGKFSDLNEAIDLAHTLQKKDFAPKIVSRQASAPVFQVLVGRFASREATGKTAEELKAKGFNALVVRN